jgi:MFS transporter, ACS family, solute carrier family 17 (sodium-dependent inorganic phosphate cotransporter), other
MLPWVPEVVTNARGVQMPWKKVLTNKPFWAILIAHAGWGFGHTICYAWLPNFYYTTYGISVQNSAWLSALPWIATVLVTNAGGYLSDNLVRNNQMDRVTSRKLLQGIGTLGPAVCLTYLAASVNGNVPAVDLPTAVSLVTVTLALGGLTCSGYASNHQDLTTRYDPLAAEAACCVLSIRFLLLRTVLLRVIC